MERYVKLNRLVFVFAALLMTIFAVTVSAQEDDTALPSFSDGRINSYDIDAPVAIYELYIYPYADDISMGVLDRVEFWGLDGQKVLDISREQIVSAHAEGSSVLVASNAGYSLYYETDGSLTAVVGVYQFNWTPSL